MSRKYDKTIESQTDSDEPVKVVNLDIQQKDENVTVAPLDVSQLHAVLSSLPPEKLSEIVGKVPGLQKEINKKALHAANESTKHEIKIFPDEPLKRDYTDEERGGVMVVVPGTGIGKNKPVTKLVSKYEYEKRLIKNGFMLKDDYDKLDMVKDIVKMYTADGIEVNVPAVSVNALLNTGLTMNKPKV